MFNKTKNLNFNNLIKKSYDVFISKPFKSTKFRFLLDDCLLSFSFFKLPQEELE